MDPILRDVLSLGLIFLATFLARRITTRQIQTEMTRLLRSLNCPRAPHRSTDVIHADQE